MIPILKIHDRKMKENTNGMLHDVAGMEGMGLLFNCLSSSLNKPCN